MENQQGEGLGDGGEAEEGDDDAGDAVDDDQLTEAETLAEQADAAAKHEPPQRRAQENAAQDDRDGQRPGTNPKVKPEKGENTQHQHQRAGIEDRHQEAAENILRIHAHRIDLALAQVLDRVLYCNLQADEENHQAADQHHPVVVPVQKLADESHGEQRNGSIDHIAQRRTDTDGEPGPTALVERPLDAHDAQRAQRNRSRQSDQDRL